MRFLMDRLREGSENKRRRQTRRKGLKRGWQGRWKTMGKDYTMRFPKPMCRCTDSPAFLYVRFTGCRATGKLQSGVGAPFLFLSVCLYSCNSLSACCHSFWLSEYFFGCTVCLSMFRYVSADFVFTIHNFTEFIIPSLSVYVSAATKSLSFRLVYRPFL